MIYSQPDTEFEASLQDATSGLGGTLGVRILDTPGNNVILGRTTVGIVENPEGSGIYSVTLTAPDQRGTYSIVWDTGGETPDFAIEELIVTYELPTGYGSFAPHYTSPDALRSELGVDDETLADERALVLIENAEDAIDSLLGGYQPDETTGRKIVEEDVEGWQWQKLSRATTKLAAKLYGDPNLFEVQWQSLSGPDFSRSGPIGSRIGAEILSVLNDSGLRRLGGHARPGPRRPLVDSFFRTSPSWRP